MVDSDCEGGRSRVHDAAAELYQLAALMLSDESQAAELVEATVAQTNIDPCAEAEAESSVRAARLNLVETALARLNQADPRAFDAPATSGEAAAAASRATTCLQPESPPANLPGWSAIRAAALCVIGWKSCLWRSGRFLWSAPYSDGIMRPPLLP